MVGQQAFERLAGGRSCNLREPALDARVRLSCIREVWRCGNAAREGQVSIHAGRNEARLVADGKFVDYEFRTSPVRGWNGMAPAGPPRGSEMTERSPG